MKHVSKVMKVSLITNVFLALLKILSGIIGKSKALIADGIHSFSDLTTDLVAIIGSFISQKPEDAKHPYGHGKIEYLTSMIIGIMILSIGFLIIYNAQNSKIVIPSIFVLFITIFTIISKLLLSSYVIKKGKKYNNNILISSGKESRMDVISSIVVLISTLLMQFSKNISILKYADIVSAIIVGIFIIKVAFDVLKDNISNILDINEQDKELTNSIKDIILKEKEIKQIENFNLIKMGWYYKLTFEVSMDEHLILNIAHEKIDNIEIEIKKQYPNIKYITIHINPYKKIENVYLEKVNKQKDKLLDIYNEYLVEIDKQINIKKEIKNIYLITVESKQIGFVYIKNNELKEMFIIKGYRNLNIENMVLDIIKSEFK